jgi:hypothetical protein
VPPRRILAQPAGRLNRYPRDSRKSFSFPVIFVRDRLSS